MNAIEVAGYAVGAGVLIWVVIGISLTLGSVVKHGFYSRD